MMVAPPTEAPKTPKTLVTECREEVNAGFVSYLISAPLHGRGSLAFWQSGIDKVNFYAFVTRFICIVDLFWHLALWIGLLVLECWTYTNFQNYMQTKHGTPEEEYRMADGPGDTSRVLLDELYVGQFTTFMIAFVGIIISAVFGFLGQPSGKAWPSTICFLFGGLKASLAFTVLIIIVASDKWTGFNSATQAGMDGHQETVTMRQMALWSVAFKFLAIAQLSANEKFWGSGSDDDMYANMCFLLGKLDTSGYKKDVTHYTSKGFLPGAYQKWAVP